MAADLIVARSQRAHYVLMMLAVRPGIGMSLPGVFRTDLHWHRHA
jgi:hypothetical protein